MLVWMQILKALLYPFSAEVSFHPPTSGGGRLGCLYFKSLHILTMIGAIQHPSCLTNQTIGIARYFMMYSNTARWLNDSSVTSGHSETLLDWCANIQLIVPTA